MKKNLISINDFSKEEILHILDVAQEFEAAREQDFLRGKVVACLFFEPSTRTRLSFEAAVNRLGARVIGFPDDRNTSVTKGETLEDTIRIISNYVDMIVMRHPMGGAASLAAEYASVPVVNAGDGAKDLKVGDNITVTGTLKHFNDGKNNTYEFDKGCTLDKVNSGSQPTETEQPPATEPPATDVGAILDVLYGLEDGKTTTETYTLSGTITKVDTPWSDSYNNITVTIVVDGYESKPVQCFRLKGDGAKDLKVGDKITVTGKFKNYNGTREFDQGCNLDSVDYKAPAVETDEDKYKTPEEIVNALYALPGGEYLNGTFTLTGKITKIDTAWSDEYKNITVTIVVGDMTDKPVMCYRLKGTGAESLKVDDVITVKGQLKNYVKDNTSTYEFDSGCELLSVN